MEVLGVLIGLLGILLNFVTYRLTKASQFQHLKPMTEARRAGVAGKWVGYANQQHEDSTLHTGIVVNLVADHKVVRGNMRITSKVNGSQVDTMFSVEGGFLHDDYLQMTYISDDRKTVHFGSFVGKLNHRAHKLTIKFCGYGAFTEKLIAGDAVLTQTPAA